MTRNSILVLFLWPAVTSFAADIKVKTTQQISGGFSFISPSSQSSFAQETTIYVHGTVERVEFVLPPKATLRQPAHIAVIAHCDTGAVYELDVDGREYRQYKLANFPSQDQFAKQMARKQKEDQKEAHFNTADTGETKDFHGLTARHLITTIKGKDKEVNYEEVVDGWYVDFPEPGCAPEYIRQHHGYLATSNPMTTVNFGPHVMPALISSGTIESTLVYSWYLPAGLATEQKSTQHQMIRVDGRLRENAAVRERKIVEFSKEEIDPALFQVPQDFRQVKEFHQQGKH